MNILIVTPELPWPPEAGGKASQFATLQALQKDHVFRIVLTREIKNLHTLAAELESRLPHVQVIREQHPALKSPRPLAAFKSAVKRALIRLRELTRRRPIVAPVTGLLPERPYYPFVPLPSTCIKRILSQRHWADLIQAEFHETLFTSFLPLGGIPRLFVCHQAHALFCKRFYSQQKAVNNVGISHVSHEILDCLSEADSQAASVLETNLLRGFQRVITFTQEDKEALFDTTDTGVWVEAYEYPRVTTNRGVAGDSRLYFDIGPFILRFTVS